MKCRGTLAVAAALLTIGSARAQVLLACTFDHGMLYNVNTVTGAASLPRATGTAHLDGIAYNTATGILYGLTNFDGTPTLNALYTINPATGTGTLVGATGLNAIVEGDLAFDPTSGALFGVEQFTGSVSQLFRMNPATGAATIVGTIPGSNQNEDYSAMAFDNTGNLYVLDTGLERLLRVNKATGAIVTSANLSPGLGPTAGMAFDPNTGTYYVIDSSNEFFTLNISTGVLTAIGSTGVATSDEMAGLAIIPVPEPTSLLMGGSCALAFFISRRRR